VVGGKASVKKIGSALKTRGESLSETPKTTPTQSAKQTKQEKTMTGQRMGTKEVGHEGKKGGRERGEVPHKG
jgi:hypothetical protein